MLTPKSDGSALASAGNVVGDGALVQRTVELEDLDEERPTTSKVGSSPVETAAVVVVS